MKNSDSHSMSRRLALMAAPAAAVALSACAAPAERASSAQSATAFVLVHGAWHGGWCWTRVEALLRAKGHRVFAPSLTGLADRSHLLNPGISLDTHVQDVVNLVEWESLESVVLVGHSYGGMVITGAAERLLPRLKAIVYLDALIPNAPNESLLDITGPADRARREAVAAGTGLLPPGKAEFLNVNVADRAWVDSKCTPHPYLTFKQGLPAIGAHERVAKKVYVRATGIKVPFYDRILAERRGRPGWKTFELPFGHDLMVDAPREVTEILLGTLS
ncbi:MAG: alpha/beta fold hydrolase [Pseudomonadota bacterium]